MGSEEEGEEERHGPIARANRHLDGCAAFEHAEEAEELPEAGSVARAEACVHANEGNRGDREEKEDNSLGVETGHREEDSIWY